MIDASVSDGTEGSTDEAASTNSVPSSTERAQLRLARVGQGKFRDALKKRWGTCGVLGCGPIDVLVASHIHAWRLCETNKARLSVDNGILLSPNLDKLFDRGFISFAPDGMLLVARHLGESDMTGLGLRRGMRLRSIYAGMKPFLKRHRADGSWIYFSHETCDFNEAEWFD
ncbi:HNH endonuclease [Pandoraea capi]|nr:HNH endonuclease signature motif containing protein [Pandoraea capi]